jgi:hypothetical protein
MIDVETGLEVRFIRRDGPNDEASWGWGRESWTHWKHELPGVYAIFRRGVLLYIGQAQNIERRLTSHELRYALDPWRDDVAIRYIRPHENLNDVETRLIRRLRPPLNLKLNRHAREQGLL